MNPLDFKAKCAGCTQEVTGRLHLDARMKVVDSDGGILFENGWKCHNCLGEPFMSSDVAIDEAPEDDESFVEDARWALSSDGTFSMNGAGCGTSAAVFLDTAKALIETQEGMSPDEFDKFCREESWIGGSAEDVRPLLDAIRKKYPDDDDGNSDSEVTDR